MVKRLLNVRHESLNKKKILEYINHDLRVKYTKHVKNENENKIYIKGFQNGLIQSYKYDKNNKENVRKMRDFISEKVEKVEELHKKLYKKTYKRNLREHLTNSINAGIISMPKDLENDFENEHFNEKQFIVAGLEAINEICKTHNLELIYVAVHFDETTPHFQYITSNFNKETGQVLQRNKETGVELQDIRGKHFEKFGITRGISKEVTGYNHVKKELEKQRNEVLKLKNENEQLKNENEELRTKEYELELKTEAMKIEFENLEKEIKEQKIMVKNFKLETQKHKNFMKNTLIPLIRQLRKLKKDFKEYVESNGNEAGYYEILDKKSNLEEEIEKNIQSLNLEL